MGKIEKEISAGGLLLKNKKILMVRVKNLEGRILWTFPKGHIEKGEKEGEAALREVREETGWKCNIVPVEKEQELSGFGLKAKRNRQMRAEISPFHKVHYQFQRAGRPVHKTVVWFLMQPIKKVQEKDSKEILKVRWFLLSRAKKIAVYPSDKKLLSKIKLPRPPHPPLSPIGEED